MGVSIQVKVYGTEELLTALSKWGADDRRVLLPILRKCGTLTGTKYIIINNEFTYSYGNPERTLHRLLDSAFHKRDSYLAFPKPEAGIVHAEALLIAHELNITLEDD